MDGGTVVTFVIREREVENYGPNEFLFDSDLENEPSIDSLIRKFESMNQDGTKLVKSQNRPLFFDVVIPSGHEQPEISTSEISAALESQTVAVSLREQKRRDAAWAAAKSEQRKRMAELQALEQEIEHVQKQKSLLSKKFDFCTSVTEKCNLIRTMRDVLAGDAEAISQRLSHMHEYNDHLAKDLDRMEELEQLAKADKEHATTETQFDQDVLKQNIQSASQELYDLFVASAVETEQLRVKQTQVEAESKKLLHLHREQAGQELAKQKAIKRDLEGRLKQLKLQLGVQTRKVTAMYRAKEKLRRDFDKVKNHIYQRSGEREQHLEELEKQISACKGKLDKNPLSGSGSAHERLQSLEQRVRRVEAAKWDRKLSRVQQDSENQLKDVSMDFRAARESLSNKIRKVFEGKFSDGTESLRESIQQSHKRQEEGAMRLKELVAKIAAVKSDHSEQLKVLGDLKSSAIPKPSDSAIRQLQQLRDIYTRSAHMRDMTQQLHFKTEVCRAHHVTPHMLRVMRVQIGRYQSLQRIEEMVSEYVTHFNQCRRLRRQAVAINANRSQEELDRVARQVYQSTDSLSKREQRLQAYVSAYVQQHQCAFATRHTDPIAKGFDVKV